MLIIPINHESRKLTSIVLGDFWRWSSPALTLDRLPPHPVLSLLHRVRLEDQGPETRYFGDQDRGALYFGLQNLG